MSERDWAAEAKALYMELCSVMHSGDAYRRGNDIIIAALRTAAAVPAGCDARAVKYKDKVIAATHRLAVVQKNLALQDLWDTPHVPAVIACYNELAELLERVAAEAALAAREGK